jgi:3-oxoadipate enol-lactonase
MDQHDITLEYVPLPTGVTLEVALVGPADAPVLAFIHGLGSSLHQFLPQAEHFSRQYRVLLVSLRGHGGSSAPASPTPDDYTLRALAEDVRALAGHLNIEALHLVGNSLGGLVGYELLTMGQPTLLSLTTFGTTAELHSSRLTYWIVVGSVRLLGVKGMAALVGKSATKDRDVGAQLERMYRRANKDALLLIPRHIADYDYTVLLRRIDLPLLLIQSAQDKDINAALDSTLAALRQAPQGKVVPLADAGHFANMEQPVPFNRILEGFLAEVKC